LVGTKVPLGMIVDITPPTVSIPKDNGATSTITKSLTSLFSSPHNTAPYTAAP